MLDIEELMVGEGIAGGMTVMCRWETLARCCPATIVLRTQAVVGIQILAALTKTNVEQVLTIPTAHRAAKDDLEPLRCPG